MSGPRSSLTEAAAGIPPAAARASVASSGFEMLRRNHRRQHLKAVALVAPLVLWLLLTFVAPISVTLWRSVGDLEVGRILPRVTQSLRDWDGKDLPPDSAFAALVADLHAGRKSGTLPIAGTRLNYDVNGFRTLLIGTARRVPNDEGANPRSTLIAIDPQWGQRETWAAIRRAGGPLTDFYVLAALDLKRDTDGAIVKSPAEEAVFQQVLLRTLVVAGGVTLICLMIGFPLAYLMAILPTRRANLLLFFVLLPFWTSILVRTLAWSVLLQREGIINHTLIAAGVVTEPLALMFNRTAVFIALIHVLLPFMVLPLYSVMKNIPPLHRRAAASLGATPMTAFHRVYLPQAMPGIGAGCTIVFIQVLGVWITPALIGSASDQMISGTIAFYASKTSNWGMAAALSLILVIATFVLYGLYQRLAGTQQLKLG
jgi:putative spermidine/putrescine transport system permease protein